MKIKPIAFGICLAVSPTALLAQQGAAQVGAAAESTEDVEVIEVTGIRRSLLESIDLKRDASTFVDAIVASDIGDFPDHNIADSLQRVTGVQIARTRGTASSVAIRGLPSNLTQVLYNGHSIASVQVGDTPNRDFTFNAMPSIFASSLVVHKSTTSDLKEGGMAGTVDINTHRAFDKGKRVIVFDGNIVHDDKSGDNSPEFSALWSDVFADDRLGATLGVSYVEQKQGVQRYRSSGNGPRKDKIDDFYVNQGMGYEHFPIERERLSVLGNLEFRPSQDLEFFAEVFHSSLDIEASRRNLTVNGREAGYLPDSLEFTEYLGKQIVQSGYATAAQVTASDQAQQRFGHMTVGLLEAKYYLDNWIINPSFSLTDSVTELTKFDIRTNRPKTQVFMDPSRGEEVPYVLFQDAEFLTSQDNFTSIGKADGDYKRDIERDALNLNLDISRSLDFSVVPEYFTLTGVKFGVGYEKAELLGGAQTIEVNTTGTDFIQANIPYLVADSDIVGNYLTPDGLSVLKYLEGLSAEEFANIATLTETQEEALDLSEDNTHAYVRFDFENGSGDLTGNFGVRYVRTEETSSGFVIDLDAGFSKDIQDNITPNRIGNVARERTYSEVLPSLNIKYELDEDQIIRFGLGKTITRPDYADLSIFSSVSSNADGNKLKYSDENIDPFVSTNVDFGYEWYFAEESSFTLGLFYKDLDSLIGTVEGAQQFVVTSTTEDPNDSSKTITTTQPEDFEVTFNSNVEGVKVRGAEFSLQLPFASLPGLWSNTGVRLNYTLVKNSEPEVLRGSSENTYNILAYYSDEIFNAKISYTYRDEYLRDLPAETSTNVTPAILVAARGNLSASVKMKVTDNLSVSLKGTNLTQEADSRFFEQIGWSNQFIDYGRRFTLGFNYKL